MVTIQSHIKVLKLSRSTINLICSSHVLKCNYICNVFFSRRQKCNNLQDGHLEIIIMSRFLAALSMKKQTCKHFWESTLTISLRLAGLCLVKINKLLIN